MSLMNGDAMLFMLGLLAQVVVIAVVAFRAGYKAAEAHLEASLKVDQVSSAALAQANNFAASLDSVRDTQASLTRAVDVSTKTSADHAAAVEESLLGLFQGLERAGLVRSAPRTTARQHGDPKTDG